MKDQVHGKGWKKGCIGIGCLEVKAAGWESGCVIGSCLQAKQETQMIMIRNSTRPEVVITATYEEWEKFKQAIKEDRL